MTSSQARQQNNPARKQAIRRGFSVIALLLLALSVYAWRRAHRPVPPLEISLWYWHNPYRIGDEEANLLRSIGVKQLFVIAGTFHCENDEIHLIGPQQWDQSPATLKVHLVFHADASLLQRFEKIPEDAMAREMSASILIALQAARRYGVKTAGVQMDLDCPTRLLERYAHVMRAIRSSLKSKGEKLPLSATALPTWYGGGAVEPLAESVDFLAPQYYESDLPKSLDTLKGISNLAQARRGLEAAGRVGAPFYAGLPAYGHALLYDDRGRLKGTYHDLAAKDALMHPAFELYRMLAECADSKEPAATNEANYAGEDIYQFKAERPDLNGRGLGWQLVYCLPTPQLLRKHLDLVLAERPRCCRGVILFRYPAPGELSSLPLNTIAAVVTARPTAPALQIRVNSRAAVWEMAESGVSSDRLSHEVTLSLTNTGSANAVLAKDAVVVNLEFDRPGFADLDPGGFDSVETFYARPGGEPPVKASRLRANRLRFLRNSLAPGETVRIGPIRTDAAEIHGDWTVIGPGKLTSYRGGIPVEKLTSPK